IEHARGYWVTSGYAGLIATSRNPVHFVPRVSRTQESLMGTAFFRGRLIAVGRGGTILQSDRLGAHLRVALDPAGIRLAADGEPGEQYRLQGSDDLATWVLLQSMTLTNGTSSLVDPTQGRVPYHFYRLAPAR